MKKSLNTVIVVLMFLVGFITSPILRSRADGGDASLIHACVKERGGDVKIVGANGPCPGGYSPLHWSITGPQGPPGPASLPSAYYQAVDPNFIPVQTHIPAFTTIGTFELPAGKWALFVTVDTLIDSANPYFAVSCQIPEVPGLSVAYSPDGIGDGYPDRMNLQMQSISNSSISTQTLTLQCTSIDGWDGFAFNIPRASLMAIQVAP